MSVIPGFMTDFVKPLSAFIFETVMPLNFSAMPDKVSPTFTIYLLYPDSLGLNEGLDGSDTRLIFPGNTLADFSANLGEAKNISGFSFSVPLSKLYREA